MSDIEVTHLGSGRYEVRQGSHRRLAYGVAAPGAIWVHLAGQVYALPRGAAVRGAQRQASPEPDEASLATPMPATVVSVAVDLDQRVTRGDLLLTLEAMKMELPIYSPKDGRVTAIRCRSGDLVQPGVPLVDIDSGPRTASS